MPTPRRLRFKKSGGFTGAPEKTKPFYPKMRGLQMKYLSGQVKTDLYVLGKLTAIILKGGWWANISQQGPIAQHLWVSFRTPPCTTLSAGQP
jgi:hypothetical protein